MARERHGRGDYPGGAVRRVALAAERCGINAADNDGRSVAVASLSRRCGGPAARGVCGTSMAAGAAGGQRALHAPRR
jgi:hypothetical protein